VDVLNAFFSYVIGLALSPIGGFLLAFLALILPLILWVGQQINNPSIKKTIIIYTVFIFILFIFPITIIATINTIRYYNETEYLLNQNGNNQENGENIHPNNDIGNVHPPNHPTINETVLSNTIRAGGQRSFVIAGDNNLYAWGDNWSGTLGDGTGEHRPLNLYQPVRILDNVIFVSDGRAITEDGTLWAWGDNRHGQIGDGTTHTRYYPVPIRMANQVIAVSDGIWSTLAITSDGQLWGWGRNDYGQLGDGTTIDRLHPIPIMSDVIAVSASYLYTMAITSDGQLWGWGRNAYGQLGDGTIHDRHFPVPIMEDIIAVSAGGSRTMAISRYGTLWAWGSNAGGGVGDGSSVNRLEPVRVALEYNVIS